MNCRRYQVTPDGDSVQRRDLDRPSGLHETGLDLPCPAREASRDAEGPALALHLRSCWRYVTGRPSVATETLV